MYIVYDEEQKLRIIIYYKYTRTMADTASSFSFSCFFHAHATKPPSGATRCRFFLFLIFNISLVYTRITLYSRRGGHSQSLLIFRYIYIYHARGGGGKEFSVETPEV